MLCMSLLLVARVHLSFLLSQSSTPHMRVWTYHNHCALPIARAGQLRICDPTWRNHKASGHNTRSRCLIRLSSFFLLLGHGRFGRSSLESIYAHWQCHLFGWLLVYRRVPRLIASRDSHSLDESLDHVRLIYSNIMRHRHSGIGLVIKLDVAIFLKVVRISIKA